MPKQNSKAAVQIDGKYYIPTNDMADILGLSPVRVRSMALRGEIPGVKMSRDWMFNPVDVKTAREEMRLHRARSTPGPQYRKAYHPDVTDLF